MRGGLPKFMRTPEDTTSVHFPNLADLAKNEDGELDTSQYIISRRFTSPELEGTFAHFTFWSWRPRVLWVSVMAFLYELYNLIEIAICHCGTRVDAFSGPTLINLLTLPSVVLLANCILFTPWVVAVLKPRFVRWCFIVLVAVLFAAYVIPSSVYLQAQPPDALFRNVNVSRAWIGENRTSEAHLHEMILEHAFEQALRVGDSVTWFIVTVMALFMLVSMVGTALGLSLIPLALLELLCLLAYGAYLALWFRHSVGGRPSALLPGLAMCYIVSLVFACVVQWSARQSFIVRIYSQHQRDVRIEQLSAEKERLEYERAMAVAKHDRGGACPAGAPHLRPADAAQPTRAAGAVTFAEPHSSSSRTSPPSPADLADLTAATDLLERAAAMIARIPHATDGREQPSSPRPSTYGTCSELLRSEPDSVPPSEAGGSSWASFAMHLPGHTPAHPPTHPPAQLSTPPAAAPPPASAAPDEVAGEEEAVGEIDGEIELLRMEMEVSRLLRQIGNLREYRAAEATPAQATPAQATPAGSFKSAAAPASSSQRAARPRPSESDRPGCSPRAHGASISLFEAAPAENGRNSAPPASPTPKESGGKRHTKLGLSGAMRLKPPRACVPNTADSAANNVVRPRPVQALDA